MPFPLAPANCGGGGGEELTFPLPAATLGKVDPVSRLGSRVELTSLMGCR